MRMNRFILIIVFIISILFVSIALAGEDKSFSWDPNTDDFLGYRLYQSQVSGQYSYGPDYCVKQIPKGTETVTLEDISDGTYFWVLTAYDVLGRESGPSNEVTTTIDVEPPHAPTNFRFTVNVVLKLKVINLVDTCNKGGVE